MIMGLRIAIVGSGIAGATAARRLVRAGMEVVVFDKGRRAGGRCNTRETDFGQWDHGAQYFTASSLEFREQVAAWQRAGVVAELPGRIASLEGGRVVDKTESPRTRYVGVPGMRALVASLLDGGPTRQGVEVAPIEAAGTGVKLRSVDGEDLGSFDRVIVTAPPSQTARLIGAVSPALAAQAQTVVVRPCWAGLVAFDGALDLPWDGAFVHDAALSWVIRDNVKPGRSDGECWVLHGSPEWSQANIDAAADDVAPRLLDAFVQVTGLTATPNVRHLSAHRWRFALPDPPLEAPFLFDAASGVGCAGDWLGGPKIEGAYLSGLRLAEHLLASEKA